MNPALWKKAVGDAWPQLAASAAILVLFAWIFVWLMSLFQLGAMETLLKLLPRFVEPMVGVPLDRLATTLGRLSILYVHVITLLVTMGWAVGRGSDVVSGEIGRGTMDLLLALPIRRYSLILSSAVVTGAGGLLLSLAVWVGTWIGIHAVHFQQPADPRLLLPGVANLAAMIFCLGGLTALMSSWDHDRWRTIWITIGTFAVSSILKLVARLWEPGAWLRYLSFLTAFEPQQLILLDDSTALAWQYSGVLVALGVAAYLLAGVVFSHRDIPQAH